MSLPASTTVGPVALTVANLDRALAFYSASLGLLVTRKEPGYAELGSESHELLQLTEDPKAQRHSRTTGLYHFAVLLPSRLDLAQSLRRIVETDTPLQGAADHLVSEAVYLADPEGNGIEIYHDRPRASWHYDGGSLRMATDPLDLQALLLEANHAPAEVPPATRMGHVHLHVAEIDASQKFYQEALGFDLTTRYGQQASFLSAGGYHHHVAINTWAGVGAPAPPVGALGLRHFSVIVPSTHLEQITVRLKEMGIPAEFASGGILIEDPSSNRIHVRTQ